MIEPTVSKIDTRFLIQYFTYILRVIKHLTTITLSHIFQKKVKLNYSYLTSALSLDLPDHIALIRDPDVQLGSARAWF
jgi:hypothetical protein